MSTLKLAGGRPMKRYTGAGRQDELNAHMHYLSRLSRTVALRKLSRWRTNLPSHPTACRGAGRWIPVYWI